MFERIDEMLGSTGMKRRTVRFSVGLGFWGSGICSS